MTQQEKQEIDKRCDEFCEYRRTHSSGYPPREWFMAGVKALDELRKPSERPNIKDYFAATETLGAIHNEIVKAPRLYAYMQALDAYIDNLEEKPSEPNKELLEAAKDALRTFYGIGCNEEAEIVQVLTKAILNYEKQSK